MVDFAIKLGDLCQEARQKGFTSSVLVQSNFICVTRQHLILLLFNLLHALQHVNLSFLIALEINP